MWFKFRRLFICANKEPWSRIPIYNWTCGTFGLNCNKMFEKKTNLQFLQQENVCGHGGVVGCGMWMQFQKGFAFKTLTTILILKIKIAYILCCDSTNSVHCVVTFQNSLTRVLIVLNAISDWSISWCSLVKPIMISLWNVASQTSTKIFFLYSFWLVQQMMDY